MYALQRIATGTVHLASMAGACCTGQHRKSVGSCCLQLTAKTTFFEDTFRMCSLNDTDEVLRPHCSKLLQSLGHANVNAPAALLGGPYASLRGSSLMEQCLVEQRYVRGAQLRTLIYNQVSL